MGDMADYYREQELNEPEQQDTYENGVRMTTKRKVERVTGLTNTYYSTRSAIEHPVMCCPSLDAAIAQAERKLGNNGEDMIYIVKIVKIVRRKQPEPEFDYIDVR